MSGFENLQGIAGLLAGLLGVFLAIAAVLMPIWIWSTRDAVWRMVKLLEHEREMRAFEHKEMMAKLRIIAGEPPPQPRVVPVAQPRQR